MSTGWVGAWLAVRSEGIWQPLRNIVVVAVAAYSVAADTCTDSSFDSIVIVQETSDRSAWTGVHHLDKSR